MAHAQVSVFCKHKIASSFSLKMMSNIQTNGRHLVVAQGSQYKATHKDMSFLHSNQEEADIKLLLHALDATVSGATRIYVT